MSPRLQLRVGVSNVFMVTLRKVNGMTCREYLTQGKERWVKDKSAVSYGKFYWANVNRMYSSAEGTRKLLQVLWRLETDVCLCAARGRMAFLLAYCLSSDACFLPELLQIQVSDKTLHVNEDLDQALDQARGATPNRKALMRWCESPSNTLNQKECVGFLRYFLEVKVCSTGDQLECASAMLRFLHRSGSHGASGKNPWVWCAASVVNSPGPCARWC
jgi:hypothetical protein